MRQFSFIFSSIHSHLFQGFEMTEDIMTMWEVADFLRLTEKTAYRLASEGKIPGFKVGGSWRFRKEEIDAWIEDKIKDTSKKSDKTNETEKRGKAA